MSMVDSLAAGALKMASGMVGMAHPAPNYRISIDGRNITPAFNARLISLTLTDNRGFEADTLDLTLDDSDGQLALPARGVKIDVALGWSGQALIDKGTFTVDEVEHSGAPDQMTIRAKSADMRAGLSAKKEKSWNGKTLADIVKTIAAEHGLKPKISAALGKRKVEHIDQTSESDVNLLTRLALDHDAIATVKKGMLLFMPAGEAESVTGIKFPTSTLVRSSGDQHRFSMAERDTYTGVKAYYQDVKKAAKGEVIADKTGVKTSSRIKAGKDPLAPSADSIKVLRHTYANKVNAERAAKAEWQRLLRGAATFSFTAAKAHPELFPELPVIVKGFKPEIDGTSWIIVRCTHNLSTSGFTTSLEMEIKPTVLAG